LGVLLQKRMPLAADDVHIETTPPRQLKAGG